MNLLAEASPPTLRARSGLFACPQSVARYGGMFGLLWLACLLAGCKSASYISVRKTPRNPLSGPLQLLSRSGPQATPRTDQLLRRYALQEQSDATTLGRLAEEIETDPQPEKLYAFAELAYIAGRRADALAEVAQIAGRRADALAQTKVALELYGSAVAHAYWYLFDEEFDHFRNPYDPQFRGACDLYNGALEAAMRIVKKEQPLRPGAVIRIETENRTFNLHIVSRGNWHEEDFGELEFVTDYEIEGLANRHHTYGLGVPLIVRRKEHSDPAPSERFYPEAISFAVTAFVRVMPRERHPRDMRPEVDCFLELHDPLVYKDIDVGGRKVPLETDLTTPLAYFLSSEELRQRRLLEHLSLLAPDVATPHRGLYMLEPYDSQKIPVLLVHGLWSSPITWMEMYNDLRSFPEIRDRYQFWFYLYPTGQPFWVSASQLRSDLQEARGVVDPRHQNAALDQMVLVGHSMGGLVSRLQTLHSDDNYWHLISEHPIDDLNGDPDAREKLRNTVYFEPNPSIRRVVTIATTHRGSEFANDYTRYLGRKLITLPEMMRRMTQSLILQNPGFFHSTDLLTISTSIDSLSPESPVLPVMLESRRAPWTRYHNIVGLIPKDGLVGRLAAGSDGVVEFSSAHLEDVESEITVSADHTSIHRHPRSILEVRRILLEHGRLATAELRERRPPPLRLMNQPRVSPSFYSAMITDQDEPAQIQPVSQAVPPIETESDSARARPVLR